MPPKTEDIRWAHQHKWNDAMNHEIQQVEQRVRRLEFRGYFASGFAAAIGAFVGSGVVVLFLERMFRV